VSPVETEPNRTGAGRLERVFREDGAVLWRTVYAYTGGSRTVADDAVAEAFARALVHEAAIRRPLPWLYRTALRLAAAEMRRQGGQAELPEGPAPEREGGTGEVVAALRKLSPAQRAAVVLHYEVDLPVKEVAERMGTSGAVVRAHLYRGRNRLRALLGEDETERAGDD